MVKQLNFAHAIPSSLLCLAIVTVMAPRTLSQVPTVAITQVQVDGSEPPDFSGWNNCIRNLGGKPYDEPKAKACLASIVGTRYFTDGRIETEPYETNEVRVVFHLDAPSLLLSRLDFDLPPPEKDRLTKWLARNPGTFQQGDIYQRDGELATWSGIENFYRSIGRHVGISETLRLDYQNATAELQYSILPGPSIPKQLILGPYSPPCNEVLGVLNFTGVDDYVPIALLDDRTKTRAFSCFDRNTVTHDQHALDRSGLFEKVQYKVSGPPNYREVDLNITGKPLKVHDVSVWHYGRTIVLSARPPAGLRTKPGSVYSRASAAADAKYLESLYSSPGNRTQVFEQEELLRAHQLRVKYCILNYKESRFFVDGRQIVPLIQQTSDSRP